MTNKKKVLSLFSILPVLIAAMFSGGCDSGRFNDVDFVFGVLSCEIDIYGGNSKQAGADIFKLLDDIDYAVSTSNAMSPVYKFNHNEAKTAADRYEIDAMAYEMAVNCREIYAETKLSGRGRGIFNPAVYPLVERWGVSSGKIYSAQENIKLPGDAEIAGYLEYCDYDYLDIIKEESGGGTKYYIAVKEEYLPKAKAMKIDFGAYAKGYAADKAAEICKKYKVKYGWIDISGNTIFIGSMPGSSDWYIDLINPYMTKNEPYFCTFVTKACSPVSSGIYRRYYSVNSQGKWEGTIYNAPIFSGYDYVYIAHIIDPESGMPVNLERKVSGEGFTYGNIKSGIINATVFSESSAVADAYATVVTVLGMEEGIKFLEEKGLRGIIITEDSRYAAVGGIKLAGAGYTEVYKQYKAVPGYEFQ